MASLEQQLLQLEKKLQKNFNDSLKKEVQATVKDEMVEAIETEVYDRYTPTMYVRERDNGGLTDKNNMVGDIINNNTLSVRNVRSDGDRDVVQTVISGVGYTWENSMIYNMQPAPRDFYEETRNRLIESGSHIKAFKEGLRRQGIGVK